MSIDTGKFFGSYFNKSLDNSNVLFWNDVLENYKSEERYENRILFFKKYEMDFQTEYKPGIPFAYAASDFNGLLLYYEQELNKQGIKEPNPNNEDLLRWYLEQDLKNVIDDQLTILEKRNYVIITNRFKLNITPHQTDKKFDRLLYNEFLESQLLEYRPQYLFSNMIAEFEKKKVPDKKLQIKATLKEIEQSVIEYRKQIETPGPVANSARMLANVMNYHHGDGEDYISDYSQYIEGYDKCIKEGYDYWPYQNKITLDFVRGKNMAMFEIRLGEKLAKNNEVISSVTSIAKQDSKPFKLLYLLMKEFEMFDGAKFNNLTAVKQAKLLSIIFKMESEGIRQDLSKVNDFINEGNNRAELQKLVEMVNTAKQNKKKKS